MGPDTHKVDQRPEFKKPELDGEDQQGRSFTVWWVAIVAGLAIVAIAVSLFF